MAYTPKTQEILGFILGQFFSWLTYFTLVDVGLGEHEILSAAVAYLAAVTVCYFGELLQAFLGSLETTTRSSAMSSSDGAMLGAILFLILLKIF